MDCFRLVRRPESAHSTSPNQTSGQLSRPASGVGRCSRAGESRRELHRLITSGLSVIQAQSQLLVFLVDQFAQDNPVRVEQFTESGWVDAGDNDQPRGSGRNVR